MELLYIWKSSKEMKEDKRNDSKLIYSITVKYIQTTTSRLRHQCWVCPSEFPYNRYCVRLWHMKNKGVCDNRTPQLQIQRLQTCEKSYETHQVGVWWRAMIIALHRFLEEVSYGERMRDSGNPCMCSFGKSTHQVKTCCVSFSAKIVTGSWIIK